MTNDNVKRYQIDVYEYRCFKWECPGCGEENEFFGEADRITYLECHQCCDEFEEKNTIFKKITISNVGESLNG